MLQSFDMILWAKASQEDFMVSVDKAYKLLLALKEYGPELSPNYLPAYHKKDVKQYDLKYATLEELLKKKRNKIFPDLGYYITFFSSLIDDDAAGIGLTIGMRDPKFVNTFTINFPLSLNIFDDNISERLIALFKECVIIFNPFWGCISNSLTLRRFGLDAYCQNDDKPTTIHWVNFWGEDIVRKISENRINNASLCSLEKIEGKGYILVLQKKPIDDNSEEDIKLQIDINKKLGLIE